MTSLALLVLTLVPHKFHASLTEMALNPESGRFEVVLRLFSDDLERALGERQQRKVVIDSEPEVARLIQAYIADKLVLKDRHDRVMAHTWVGHEIEVKHTWVYVEIEAPKEMAGASLSNTVFMELFGDQVNTVNLSTATAKASMIFKSGLKERPLGLE